MGDIAREIEETEARLAQLRLIARTGDCREFGHAWKFYGGRNAACGDGCNCSVPVYVCPKCGDCDYGDNAEAADKISDCQRDRDDE